MATVTISPNMSLPVPVVSLTPGPEWSQDYNSCLSIVDQHNHSSGSGVQITQDGINLTASTSAGDSLNFQGTNAYGLRSARFTAQSAPLNGATDLGCIYESGVDLYYNDGNGNQIRLTQGGSIVGTAGSITGLPSGTASASYAAGTFTWQSATNVAAAMDNGAVTIRDTGVSANGVTISAPNPLAGSYGIVLPTGAPASTSIVLMSSTGALSTTLTPSVTSLSATTIAVSTSIQIGGGPILTNSSNNLVLSAALILGGSSGPGIGKTITNTVTQLASDHPILINFNTSGVAMSDYSTNTLQITYPTTTSSKPVVVSASPATNGLMIVRGFINGSGGTTSGEGFTFSVSTPSNFVYTITFTTPFQDTPVVTANFANSLYVTAPAVITAQSTTGVTIDSGSSLNASLNFIAIGQRKTST